MISIQLGLFYYDVSKDILLLSLLNQVEITLFEDVEETTEYDFGGLNSIVSYSLQTDIICS